MTFCQRRCLPCYVSFARNQLAHHWRPDERSTVLVEILNPDPDRLGLNSGILDDCIPRAARQVRRLKHDLEPTALSPDGFHDVRVFIEASEAK
jgi:hypothetical protein